MYANLPTDLNFLIVGYAYSHGGISTDASLPLQNADIKIHTPIVSYARSIDLFGMSGKLDAIVPTACLSGSADVSGVSRERDVCGLADPRFRISTNFYGAPALSLKEFASYKQDIIVGGSLQIGAPLGQYDSTKLVNIGANRWLFKPELGGSKRFGPLTLELSGAATFFTQNDDFYGGTTRDQDPIYAFQAHAVYALKSGIWAALDCTYYMGGRSTVDGVENDDRQENDRLGLTLAFPIDKKNSIKLYGSTGLYTRTGGDYDIVGVAWQYRWGAGL